MKPVFLLLFSFLLSGGTEGSAEVMVKLCLQEARKELTEHSDHAKAAFTDNRCYRCGVCCKEMPCRYGDWDAVRHQCAHLAVDTVTPEYTTFKCNKYSEIVKQDEGRVLTIFGSGCSNLMHNQARERIRRRILCGK